MGRWTNSGPHLWSLSHLRHTALLRPVRTTRPYSSESIGARDAQKDTEVQSWIGHGVLQQGSLKIDFGSLRESSRLLALHVVRERFPFETQVSTKHSRKHLVNVRMHVPYWRTSDEVLREFDSTRRRIVLNFRK